MVGPFRLAVLQAGEEEPELARTLPLGLARVLALRLRMASDVIAGLRG